MAWRSLRLQVAVVMAGLFCTLGYAFYDQRQEIFLPGTTSDGHYLIESACSSCHGGFEPVGNESCVDCHRSELAVDTHSTKIFDDPRWAEDLQKIDAMLCVTCHQEHLIASQGVTIDPGFCFPCHDDVVETRPTHRDLEPTSCADAGCHNYHDNQGINTAFLSNNSGRPALLENWATKARTSPPALAAGAAEPSYPAGVEADGALLAAWSASAHAAAEVGCQACHLSTAQSEFNLEVGIEVCGSCHGYAAQTFSEGKHGARSAVDLAALRPEQARLPMHPAGPGRPDQLSCSTCHDPHSVDTRQAAVAACTSCHADEHTQSFAGSPHALTIDGSGGSRPGTREVTCATCHLPRVSVREGGEQRVLVNHSNTFTLRPTDRMVKLVCLDCHSIELSLSAALDPELIANNFRGQPQREHESFAMVTASDRP